MAHALPSTTRAAVLVEQRQPLVVDRIGLPGRLEYGQVLVRVLYSGVCGSQLGEIDGVKGPDPHLPHLLGHEGGGRVLAVGPGVTTVKTGDPVVLHWRPGTGIAAAPPRYDWKGTRVNAGWVTTFNEHAVVSENRVTAVPEELPLDLAPLFGCAITTGFGVVNNNARLRPGESIAVFGAGGVGLSVIQGAALVSAHPIIAVDLYDAKLELAARMGASHCVNSRSNEATARIRDLVGAGGVDVAVDNTGNVAVIRAAYDVTGPRGRTILVGVPKKGDDISIHSLPLHFGKVLTGSHGGEAEPALDIPRYAALHLAGRLPLAPLITERVGLGRLNDAIAAMRNGEVSGRCLIDLSDGEG